MNSGHHICVFGLQNLMGLSLAVRDSQERTRSNQSRNVNYEPVRSTKTYFCATLGFAVLLLVFKLQWGPVNVVLWKEWLNSPSTKRRRQTHSLRHVLKQSRSWRRQPFKEKLREEERGAQNPRSSSHFIAHHTSIQKPQQSVKGSAVRENNVERKR